MNRKHILIGGLILVILILSIVVVWNRYESYRMGIEFRLDPLETYKSRITVEEGMHGLWVLGDSRAFGWDASLLPFLHQERYNLAIGGQTSRQVVERFSNDLQVSTPEIILLQVGINDLKGIGMIGDRAITENCITNIIQILDLCRQHQVTAIHSSIFPVGTIELYRRPVWDAAIYDAIIYVNQTVQRYCQSNGIAYFDAYELLMRNDGSPKVREEFERDMFHLNRSGYVYLSNHLRDQLPALTIYQGK